MQLSCKYKKSFVNATEFYYFCTMAIQRQTATVKLLWEQFEESRDALSVVYLVKHLKVAMNKSTVYRILDRMEESGKLHSFIGKNGLKWYAKCQDCSSANHIDIHPHFQCNECGREECLTEEIKIPRISKHQIHLAQVLLLGHCETCLN